MFTYHSSRVCARPALDVGPQTIGDIVRVGELVAKLGSIILQSGRPLSHSQLHMVQALRMLPEVVALRRLDNWEAAFPPSNDADDQMLNRLLEAVYELRRYNLYTQFNPEGTLRAYATIAAMMQAQGFEPPVIDAITDW